MFCLSLVLLFFWIPAVSLQNLMFAIEPKSVIVRRGSPVILNCQTNNQTSDIVIQWRKGYGTPWIHDYTNKPYKKLTNYSLYFPSVQPGDEDAYFCAAYQHGTGKTIYSHPAHITLAYINSAFITPPSLSPSIREHDTVTLTCVSGASQPLPSVTWEKDGRPIVDQSIVNQHQIHALNATSAAMQLKNVSVLADRGYYRCVAINPLLPDEPRRSQRVYLMVLPTSDEPRIEVPPVNTISPRRHPLRLDCVILGVPPPVVFWLHNNVRVDNTSNRVVYLNGSLFIRSLSLQDSGQYSCNGTNSKGSVASSDIFLNVAFFDFVWKRNPENITAVNGSRVEMICEPPNHFPNTLHYQWYKNYRKINVAGRIGKSSSGSLIISPVLKSDEGVYLCDASLSQDHWIKTRTSTLGYLTVNVPPYFLIKPSDQIIVLGQTLLLTCKAAGFPKPMLKWHHGMRLLSNTSRLTLGADGSLVLSRVNINDAGQYECSVENSAGINDAMANVIVHAPPNGTVMPIDTETVLGNNATFLCQFAGNPPPVIIWYFKRANERAVLLARNSSRYIQNDEKLIVVNVSEDDNGVFTCVGENVVGMKNFSAHLMVLVPARFVDFPRNTTVNESDVAEFTCHGHGNPAPDVMWSLNGTVLTNSSRISVTGGNLMIRNVRRNDTGMYACTVENYLRSQTSSAYLTVQVSPTIHEVLGSSRVQWRQNTSFSCKSDGVPTPRIIWFKDMKKISSISRIYAQGNELHIISSENSDTGNYTCEASNLLGSTKMTRQLFVEVSPSPPLDLKIREITSTSLRILWHSGFHGYSPITSYKLEIRTNSTRMWRTVSEQIKSENYTVDSLKPYTVYHLRVFAENKIGWSQPSETVTDRTAEDSPSSPTDLQCKTINFSTIFLTWNKPTLPNGKLREYKIQYSNNGNHTDVVTASMTHYIHELHPFTWYKFRVQAATGGNPVLFWGNYSSFVSCRSGQAAPRNAPRNLTLTSSGPYSIFAKWEKIPIGSENGIVVGYYLRYNTTRDGNYTIIFVSGNDTLQYNTTGLSPWTNYVVQVAAFTVATGPWTGPKTSRTDESVPSAQPSNIVVEAITSNSLSVNWEPPPSENHNGVIRGYMVLYAVADSTSTRRNLTTNETSVKLSGLMIFTSYVVKVRAFTHVGFGPYSDDVVNKTLESYPSSVTGLTYNITKTSVIVSWQPPQTPNGIITSYTTYLNTTTVRIFRRPGTNITMFNMTSQSHQNTTRVTQIVLTGFYGNVTYSLCVAARTSVGYGPCSHNLVFTTNFTKKVFFKEEDSTSSFIDDNLPLIAGGATILFVLLIAIFVCCFIRRTHKKKNDKETKQTFNFQRNNISMRSVDDGESSYASRDSKPIYAYSVDSSSVHSHTNPNNDYAVPEGRDGSPLVRLRNTSLTLGSDASSYDAPYSSVAEIGVDPTTPHGETPRHFVNALFTERELEDTRGETESLDSRAVFNPIYEPSYAQLSRPENLQGALEDYRNVEHPTGAHAYVVLSPPPEYLDFGDDTDVDELPHAYTNAVTDF